MDKVLKQRLIGASILIALAVIFVPMLFEGPQDASISRELNIDLPDAPDDRGPVRRIPLDPQRSRAEGQTLDGAPDDSAVTRIEPPRIEPAANDRPDRDALIADIENQVSERPRETESTPPETAVPAEPVTEPDTRAEASDAVSVARTEPEASVEPAPPETVEAPVRPAPDPVPADASTDPLGFQVQVASFGSLENAEDLVARLTRLGHVAGIDRLVRGPSELHRVRTGPYEQRADAERALAQIQQTVAGVDPVIVGAAPSQLPARDEASGFAVQVGSFASRNNAVRLLDQLSALGYDAFVHQDTAGSRTIWRVRVGPLGSREDAAQRLARMTENDGIDGLVVSHP
jgi:cell division septation protein DedD